LPKIPARIDSWSISSLDIFYSILQKNLTNINKSKALERFKKKYVMVYLVLEKKF
jgi:hypothetical protein